MRWIKQRAMILPTVLVLVTLLAAMALHVLAIALEHWKSTQRLLHAFTQTVQAENRQPPRVLEHALDFVPDHLAFDCEDGLYVYEIASDVASPDMHRAIR